MCLDMCRILLKTAIHRDTAPTLFYWPLTVDAFTEGIVKALMWRAVGGEAEDSLTLQLCPDVSAIAGSHVSDGLDANT